jgi:N-carbamoyl-L-amino-acid hydrolase
MTKPTAEAIRQAVLNQRAMVDALFAALRADGLDEPGISRDPYGAGEQRAHATVTRAAEMLGLEIDHDAAANLYMTMPGRDRAAPAIVFGSHLDSVPHGGNFDGAAGVVAGLAVTAALRSLDVTPSCDVVVMGIRAEESVWFQVSYAGSRGSLGTLPAGALDARRIDTGRTLSDHIADCGGDPAALLAGARHFGPERVRAFVELHIEQAPGLVEADKPIAICTGIPGNFRYPAARIVGRTDHVGTPRRFRRDASLAGAAFALALDELWAEYDANGIPMAYTLGRFHTDSAEHGMTSVPGLFHFSLDVRAYTPDVLAALEQRAGQIAAAAEQRYGVRFEFGPRTSAQVGVMDPGIQAGLEKAAKAQNLEYLKIGSPASHDAAAFAAAGIPAAMLFVRNENGSHNPAEDMQTNDFLDGAAVLLNWLTENM